MSYDITEMLSYCRPASSKTEKKFINRYIRPLGVEADGYGNLYKRIGDVPIMWSCHTDTVHKRPGKQLVIENDGMVSLNKFPSTNCLGADDTAGVWIMSEMIKEGKPGLYVFHREEENGPGKGSSFIADHNAGALKGIKAAIAFDRKGKTDVITHQLKRTCSDEFAQSLAKSIGIGLTPNENGVFTDTANYTDLIGECTNISVGYENAHTNTETLDTKYLTLLRDRVMHIEIEDLKLSRQPGDTDPFDYLWDGSAYGSAYGYGSYVGQSHNYPKNGYLRHGREQDIEEEFSLSSIYAICENYPNEVADWLEQQGVDHKEIADYIKRIRGRAKF